MLNPIVARLEIGFFDAREALSDVPAKVEFHPGGMTLLTENATMSAHYHGERHGQGHYVLRAPEAQAEGTLHRFADSAILEGFWRMNGERGFWRLRLPADTVVPENVPPAKAKARPKAASRPRGRKRVRLAH